MIGNDLLMKNPLWIVDVGASGGIDNRWKKFTSCFVAVLFEPDPREYEILKPNGDKNWIIINSALSDSIKEIDFHLCKKQQVSSVYLPNFDFLNKFPDAERHEVIRTIKIWTDTLDNQLKKNNIPEIDFIKIDAQGYELPILRGSINTLEKVICLELEVEFAALYRDQHLFNEVDNFVRGMNFELFDIKRYFWRRNNSKDFGNRKGQIVFGDALYFKSPEQILLMNDLTQEKIIRSICVYLAYGYPDLAQTLFNSAYSKGILSRESHNSIALIILYFKDRNPIPAFKGKGRLKGLFQKISNIFSDKGPYTSDEELGNQ